MSRSRPWSRARLVRALGAIAASVVTITSLTVFGAGQAAADPSANAWAALRQCESSGRYDINTGNGYYGAYQFSLSTWQSVGGTGLPSDASPAEQDYRALILYRMRGWQPWTCATMLGLPEDADARSKVVPPAPASFDTPYQYPAGSGSADGSTAGSSVAAPAWPGQEFAEGDYSDDLGTWQRQLAALGYSVIATGYFGPSTAAAVLDVQGKAGLTATGTIDADTWSAAWTLAGSAGASGSSGSAGSDAEFRPQTKEDCRVGAATAPAAPATLQTYGQTTREIQCWQWQAATRGAGLGGTAYFGDVTLTAVTQVQQQNGIGGEVDGRGRPAIGPRTWAAVWTGTASF